MTQQAQEVPLDQARADAIYEALRAYEPELVESKAAGFRRDAARLAVHPDLLHLEPQELVDYLARIAREVF